MALPPGAVQSDRCIPNWLVTAGARARSVPELSAAGGMQHRCSWCARLKYFCRCGRIAPANHDLYPNDVAENGEHTPLAGGSPRRAANFLPTIVLDQAVGRFVKTKPTARRRRQHAGRMRSLFSTASFRPDVHSYATDLPAEITARLLTTPSICATFPAPAD